MYLGAKRRYINTLPFLSFPYSPEMSAALRGPVDVVGCWLVPSWRAAQPRQEEVLVVPATMAGPGDNDEHVYITCNAALPIRS